MDRKYLRGAPVALAILLSLTGLANGRILTGSTTESTATAVTDVPTEPSSLPWMGPSPALPPFNATGDDTEPVATSPDVNSTADSVCPEQTGLNGIWTQQTDPDSDADVQGAVKFVLSKLGLPDQTIQVTAACTQVPAFVGGLNYYVEASVPGVGSGDAVVYKPQGLQAMTVISLNYSSQEE
eukprot:jgi/Tetstr1/448321/TSEL_035605.t1